MRKIKFFSILLISHLSVVSLFANLGDANIGAKLFEGTTHFKNGGVACIACHAVNSELVEGGGNLAMDLTAMGGAGIGYAIENPQNASSAVMKNAFEGKALTADEQANLIAFFDKVADSGASAKSSNSFVISGIVGAIIIFIILSFLGRNRIKQSVNQEIYDRQLKSSWKGDS
jgi:hypothetical protein